MEPLSRKWSNRAGLGSKKSFCRQSGHDCGNCLTSQVSNNHCFDVDMARSFDPLDRRHWRQRHLNVTGTRTARRDRRRGVDGALLPIDDRKPRTRRSRSPAPRGRPLPRSDPHFNPIRAHSSCKDYVPPDMRCTPTRNFCNDDFIAYRLDVEVAKPRRFARVAPDPHFVGHDHQPRQPTKRPLRCEHRGLGGGDGQCQTKSLGRSDRASIGR
jgi:hypothetical protein